MSAIEWLRVKQDDCFTKESKVWDQGFSLYSLGAPIQPRGDIRQAQLLPPDHSRLAGTDCRC